MAEQVGRTGDWAEVGWVGATDGAGVAPSSAAELAYLAGVLDTRAVVRTRLVGASQSVLPYLAMSCGDAPLLTWLSTITGVRAIVTERKYDKHRCLEHCTKAHDHIRSVSGRWSLSGARATVLLTATEPYVVFQREAWQRAVAVGLSAERKSKVVRKMTALGWPLPAAWESTTE